LQNHSLAVIDTYYSFSNIEGIQFDENKIFKFFENPNLKLSESENIKENYELKNEILELKKKYQELMNIKFKDYKLKKRKRNSNSKSNKYLCICGKHYANKSNLNRHVNKNINEKGKHSFDGVTNAEIEVEEKLLKKEKEKIKKNGDKNEKFIIDIVEEKNLLIINLKNELKNLKESNIIEIKKLKMDIEKSEIKFGLLQNELTKSDYYFKREKEKNLELEKKIKQIEKEMEKTNFKYYCEVCEFRTNKSSHWESHCSTNKHLNNIKK